jgi:hypothetical protein
MDRRERPLDDKLGAAVLGMSAAIKICRWNDIDPHDLVDLLLQEVFTPEGFAYKPFGEHADQRRNVTND